jgi:hypothetical protein
MGAVAYYNACAEKDASHAEPPRVERRAVVSDVVRSAVVIPLARL